MRQQRGCRLEKIGLVGRATALGHEQEFVGVQALRVDLDLGGQIVLRVLFFEHRQGRELRIAQVALFIGIHDALRNSTLVLPVGPDEAPLLAHDDRSARVLAHRQHAACRDIGILEQVIGDKLVIRRRFRVVEDLGELRKMSRPQQVVDVHHGLLGQKADRLAADIQHLAIADPLDAHALARQFAVGCRILAKTEERAVLIGHRWDPGGGDDAF